MLGSRALARLSSRSRSLSTLVLAEAGPSGVNPGTLSVIEAGSKIGNPVDVLVAGSHASSAADALAKVDGVATVLVAESGAYDNALAEAVTPLLEKIQADKSYTHILAAATNEGKNIVPRLAAKLDVACLSDVVSVESQDTFSRPIYAGNAIATFSSKDPVKLMTIRTTSFEKANAEGGSASIEKIDAVDFEPKSSFLENVVEVSDRPDLAAASKVVAGGRGVKSAQGFEDVIFPLADKLEAAVGASRAAVDAGYVANELQVGQTGKVVAPELYVAVGISGAIQHLAGMKDSKCIVAINKDPEAPIFQVSDFGLEADLFKACPEMLEKL